MSFGSGCTYRAVPCGPVAFGKCAGSVTGTATLLVVVQSSFYVVLYVRRLLFGYLLMIGGTTLIA